MKKYYSFNRKNYKNFLILFLFIHSYYLFFLSLEKCYDGESNCCRKLRWIKMKIIEEVISCLLTIISLVLIILKKASRLHLIHFIVVFSAFYYYSHGIDFDDHGYYNIKYFFVIIVPFVIIIYLFILLLSIKNKNMIIIFLLILILFLFLFKNIIYKSTKCINWGKGLNNTYIDNNKEKYECSIRMPKYCPFIIGKNFLDRDRFSSCIKKSKNSKELILSNSASPYINENTSHIGFPLTNRDEKFFHNIHSKTFLKYIYENLIDMNNLTMLKKLNNNKPEISVDFSQNKNGKLNINLHFNKSLSEERKSLEKIINPLSKNIMIIFIDSVSRALSIRQLKKTLNFFERFISFKGNRNLNFPDENFHSFQFFKYHSHKYYTSGNYPILFYGKHRDKTDKSIAFYLKKNGFITCYTSDNCYNDFTRCNHNFTFDDIYDHQYLICDPNYFNHNSKLNCFYDKIHVEYMLEYNNQFWRKYHNNRKFSLLLTNFAHESTLEKLKYIDNLIYNFLNKLYQENLLKETSIFLLSDHGVGVPSIYYLNDFFQIEKALPMFYLIVNDRKNQSYEFQYRYIYQNQQTFITGFDIFNTIIHLIYGDKYGKEETKNIISPYGASLFNKINQKKRSPKRYASMVRDICI